MIQKNDNTDNFVLAPRDKYNQVNHTVVFIDIVGFTQGEKSNEELLSCIAKFEQQFWFVFDPKEYWGERPEERDYHPNTMIVLPTGDGLAIGFDPAKQDTEILSYVRELHKKVTREGITIRIGVNRGECYVVRDVNGRENLVGWGIVYAQRIMDIAQDNQILCSASFAQPVCLAHKIKELHHIPTPQKIKHAETADVYNYYKEEEFGNKNLPLSKY